MTSIINAAGRQAIASFVAANSRHGAPTEAQLQAWIDGAEFGLDQDGVAAIELKAQSSIHGRTQVFVVPDEGIDEVAD